MKPVSANNVSPPPLAPRSGVSGGSVPSGPDAFARALGAAASAPSGEHAPARGTAGEGAQRDAPSRGAHGSEEATAKPGAEAASGAVERSAAERSQDASSQAKPSAGDGASARESAQEVDPKDAIANVASDAGRKIGQAEGTPANDGQDKPPASAASAADSKGASNDPATSGKNTDAAAPLAAERADAKPSATSDEAPSVPAAAAAQTADGRRADARSAAQNDAASAKSAIAAAAAGKAASPAMGAASSQASDAVLRSATGDKGASANARLIGAERLLRGAGGEGQGAAADAPKAATDNVVLPRALARELASLLAQRSETASTRLASEGATTASNASAAGTVPGVAGVFSATASGAATQGAPAGTAAGGPPLPSGPPQQLAEMASRVLVDAASEGNWRVTLRLDPPDMGRLDVQISREQGALTAHFVASTAGARAAMEQAMPMLQSQMAEQGMSLADTSVSQEHAGGQNGNQNGDRDASASGGFEAAGEPLVTNAATVRRERGLFEGWA